MRNKSVIYIALLFLWIFLFHYKEASTNFVVYNWLNLPYESKLSETALYLFPGCCPCCMGTYRKGCSAWNCTCFYDVGNCNFAT